MPLHFKKRTRKVNQPRTDRKFSKPVLKNHHGNALLLSLAALGSLTIFVATLQNLFSYWMKSTKAEQVAQTVTNTADFLKYIKADVALCNRYFRGLTLTSLLSTSPATTLQELPTGSDILMPMCKNPSTGLVTTFKVRPLVIPPAPAAVDYCQISSQLDLTGLSVAIMANPTSTFTDSGLNHAIVRVSLSAVFENLLVAAGKALGSRFSTITVENFDLDVTSNGPGGPWTFSECMDTPYPGATPTAFDSYSIANCINNSGSSCPDGYYAAAPNLQGSPSLCCKLAVR